MSGTGTAFQEAILLRTRCEMESLISRRHAMIAANNAAAMANQSAPYDREAFDENARAFHYLAPNPHEFT